MTPTARRRGGHACRWHLATRRTFCQIQAATSPHPFLHEGHKARPPKHTTSLRGACMAPFFPLSLDVNLQCARAQVKHANPTWPTRSGARAHPHTHHTRTLKDKHAGTGRQHVTMSLESATTPGADLGTSTEAKRTTRTRTVITVGNGDCGPQIVLRPHAQLPSNPHGTLGPQRSLAHQRSPLSLRSRTLAVRPVSTVVMMTRRHSPHARAFGSRPATTAPCNSATRCARSAATSPHEPRDVLGKHPLKCPGMTSDHLP